jgi:hypothetical protein
MSDPKGSSALSELIARLVEMARKVPPQEQVEFLEVLLLASSLQEHGVNETPIYRLSRDLLREGIGASLGDELAPGQIERVTSTAMALLHLKPREQADDATRIKTSDSKKHLTRGN